MLIHRSDFETVYPAERKSFCIRKKFNGDTLNQVRKRRSLKPTSTSSGNNIETKCKIIKGYKSKVSIASCDIRMGTTKTELSL